MIKLVRFFFISIGFLFSSFGYATLHLELTQGIDFALPITIIPFGGQEAQTNLTVVSDVIQQDLYNSGRFRLLVSKKIFRFPHVVKEIDRAYWKSVKVNDVIIGNLKKLKHGQYQINFALVDLYAKPVKGTHSEMQGVILDKSFTTTASGLRMLSHHISDMIYEKLIGKRGIFSTKIAYVLEHGETDYQLVLSDYDGYGAQTILRSSQPILSPTWSPDGKAIAYVSFEKGNPAIYLHILATGERKKITNYPGINGAPAFSPDGKNLALVLTLSDSPNIYIKNLVVGDLKQITYDNTIDTEPAWSPDGKYLLYTSDRGGAPQIYQVNLSTGKVIRVSYDGKYNARASFTSDGQNIVMLHRTDEGVYSIAIQNLLIGRLQVLAQEPYTQSPSVAPNGDMIIYSWRNEQGRFLLGIVSSDGKVQLRLPSRDGDLREPAWGPFS